MSAQWWRWLTRQECQHTRLVSDGAVRGPLTDTIRCIDCGWSGTYRAHYDMGTTDTSAVVP